MSLDISSHDKTLVTMECSNLSTIRFNTAEPFSAYYINLISVLKYIFDLNTLIELYRKILYFHTKARKLFENIVLCIGFIYRYNDAGIIHQK